MKQYQIHFENKDSFVKEISDLKDICNSFNHGDITFFMTWKNDVSSDVDFVMDAIAKEFPDAISYGSEASGSILEGKMVYGINITCFVFEKESTSVELAWVKAGEKLSTLDDLWAYCNTKKNLKAIELIPTIIYLELLGLEGNVPTIDENIYIFGGSSLNYDNPGLPSEIVAGGHPRTTEGMVAVLYYGDELSFDSSSVLGWKGLGKLMYATSCDGKVIHEIDETPSYAIYEKYLGLTMEDSDTLVFPLMVEEDGIKFIRTPLCVNEDRSMTMMVNIPEGTACRIAYGDKNTILNEISDRAKSIAELCPQGIRVFSCGGRRYFWGDDEVGKETEILQEIAPVSGFYTGGEIMRINNKVRVLNQTLTFTSIRECGEVQEDTKVILGKTKSDKSLVARLAYFTETVSKEQEQERMKLKQDMEIISGLASQYTTLYLMNMDTGEYLNYGYSDRVSEVKDIIPEAMTFRQLRDAALASGMVHPESVEDFKNFFSNEKDKIRNNKTASLLFKRKYGDDYLWTRALAVKCEDASEEPHHAVLGMIECDKEVRRDEAIHKFTDVLERGQNPEISINNILYALADYYQADRAYVMEFNSKGRCVSSTYSWNKEGIVPIDMISYPTSQEQFDKWTNEFMTKGYIYHETQKSDGKNKEFFLKYQIYSCIAVPLINNENIIGYVGVDNPKRSTDDAGIGKIASAVVNSEILRRKENDEEHITLAKLSDSYVSVYYTNLDADSIRAWKISEGRNAYDNGIKDYSEVVKKYIHLFAIESERDYLLEVTKPESIINRFKDAEQFSIEVTGMLFGTERNLSFDFIRVTDDGKQFVIACRDITEMVLGQKEHQKQLQEALDMAKSADRAKTEFLFNMSHDIRTPMNAILGFTDMAIRHFNDEERALDSLQKIKSSGGHLLNLINDILEMSRIESGKFELGEAPIDLIEAIKNVENMTQSLSVPKSIDYKVVLGDIRNKYIYADELHINEVIVNLISNSIKYTNEDGRVRYTINQLTDVEDGKVWFRFDVSDNGIGMSEEFQKHLFEAFSREKSSTVSKIQGAGLGLSIVKRIVDLAGGKITVNSKLGEGSSFIVDLPFRVMDQEAIDKFAPEQEHKHDADIKEDVVLEGRRVLLVEDNEMNREIADEILTEAGLVIETAENGQIAVDMVSDKGINYYDFVLMDIQMPVLDGYGATAAIRNLPDGDKLTIIALSANAFDEDKKKSISMGMNAHVAKPIDVKVLFDVMHDLA